MDYLFIIIVGLLAGTLAGIIGTGSSIILLPILFYSFGAKVAVPVMAVAAVLANLGRVIIWWRQIHWPAVLAYSLTSIPAAALGANTLISMPENTANLILGCFFLIMLPLRRHLKQKQFSIKLWQLGLAGVFIGFITGIVVSSGPLSIAAFAAFGLLQGPLIASEAAASMLVYLAKLSAFDNLDVLNTKILLNGFIVGSTLIIGAWLGKHIVLQMRPRQFERILDLMMLIAGLSLLCMSASTP
ncbi:sulfite exporter TauE/SafE family protein [Aliamphritea ceti]|uniref:sulfite exporter TauE/SafE family protein n=1 Tax=Aliamphritea ceti TaxID=1524258 RepID=UPI0021C3E5F6|nr:sulfite exporter TauE/SafE family protein [Aliamphritea ceti]